MLYEDFAHRLALLVDDLLGDSNEDALCCVDHFVLIYIVIILVIVLLLTVLVVFWVAFFFQGTLGAYFWSRTFVKILIIGILVIFFILRLVFIISAIDAFILLEVFTVFLVVILHVDLAVLRPALLLILVRLAVLSLVRIVSYLLIRVLILFVIFVCLTRVGLCLVAQLQFVRAWWLRSVLSAGTLWATLRLDERV